MSPQVNVGKGALPVVQICPLAAPPLPRCTAMRRRGCVSLRSVEPLGDRKSTCCRAYSRTVCLPNEMNVHRARLCMPGLSMFVGSVLPGCELPDMGHQSTCDDSICGGNVAVLWGTSPVTPGQHPSFTFSLVRNGQIFPEKTAQLGDAEKCDTSNDDTVCLSLVSPGEFCGPNLDRVGGTDPVVCMSVGVDGLKFPFVNGDDYRLVVKDDGGRTIVDEHWIATYTDREPPPVCKNTNNIRCRFGDHRFSVQP